MGNEETRQQIESSTKWCFICEVHVSLLAWLWLGCGGSQWGETTSLSNLFLTFLFGLLQKINRENIQLYTIYLSFTLLQHFSNEDSIHAFIFLYKLICSGLTVGKYHQFNF